MLDITDEELMDGTPLLPVRAPATAQTVSSYHAGPATAMDPSTIGFPPMLAYEVAMRTAPIEQIFEGYGLTVDHYDVLRGDPKFQAAVATATDELKTEGMSFKIKAKLQAEELMKQSWKMIHDVSTPASVRADLIKSTVRWAGYEPKGTDMVGGGGTALQININLGDSK